MTYVTPPSKSQQVLDREALLGYVRHDAGFLNDLLQAFLGYHTDLLGQIERSIRENDANELFERAHQFKGALCNFHAIAAVESSRELEHLGKTARLDQAMVIFKQLQSELTDLIEEIRLLLEKLDANESK